MILELTFEEVTALNSAAERIRSAGSGGVAAPPEALAALDERLPLQGDVSIRTLPDQARLLLAMDFVLGHLKERMDALVLEQYVGADDAVNAYFDYANVLTARSRLHALGLEMQAMADLISREEPEPGDDDDQGVPD